MSVHGGKSTKTLSEQQEYVVSAIADIGPVTARSLLEEFGTVEAVMTAREEDLLEVSGIGSVTAERIRDVIGATTKPSSALFPSLRRIAGRPAEARGPRVGSRSRGALGEDGALISPVTQTPHPDLPQRHRSRLRMALAVERIGGVL